MDNRKPYPLIVILALFMSAHLAGAQVKEGIQYKYDISIGTSGAGSAATNYFRKGYLFHIGCFDPREDDDVLERVYGTHEGATYGTGYIQTQASVYLTPWLVQSLGLGFGQYWGSDIDNLSGEKISNKSGTQLTLMPELKIMTGKQSRRINFYTSIALGTGFYMGSGFEKMRSHDSKPSSIHQRLECEWVPAGFIFSGKRLFFSINLGVGTLYDGVLVGMGYRL